MIPGERLKTFGVKNVMFNLRNTYKFGFNEGVWTYGAGTLCVSLDERQGR